MADETIHDLTAAYALDALDEGEVHEYEEHLGSCERCREELASLQDAASALAYAVPPVDPPAGLRERILEQAREERRNVVPLRPRWRARVPAAIAVAAAAASIATVFWATTVSNELEQERSLIEILADPQARSVALQGANGRLVVTDTGRAALVVAGLDEAPEGRTYEVWVAERGVPVPAGVFDGGDDRDVVEIERAVPRGARVMVTIERAGGVDAPTSRPIITARA